ncbi:uncharacterized protein BDZ83DRAFT_181200 [Colletotrichum acutatum]|uniref:Uncharacterized protein n=1 Tax=Glomerella acutata TaxID=27357 RepID=A0AAD8XH98_GLOAC|nr:uncharacterized protein BDZ83DRAFT_181200 [Colletotrichum acutatum]KAK1727919.1 hypothetical protein BDZ83DRAFT_181200 [Colletotrichum acutatum]
MQLMIASARPQDQQLLQVSRRGSTNARHRCHDCPPTNVGEQGAAGYTPTSVQGSFQPDCPSADPGDRGRHRGERSYLTVTVKTQTPEPKNRKSRYGVTLGIQLLFVSNAETLRQTGARYLHLRAVTDLGLQVLQRRRRPFV